MKVDFKISTREELDRACGDWIIRFHMGEKNDEILKKLVEELKYRGVSKLIYRLQMAIIEKYGYDRGYLFK